MKKESNILKRIMLKLSGPCRLFRINTGRAWTGNNIVKFPQSHPQFPGAVLIKDPRPFQTGTPNGYSDLSGWSTVEVTPNMVGKTICIFTVIEVKSPKGRASDNQKNFISQVLRSGGVAFIARSDDEALDKLNDRIGEIQHAGPDQ
jgi:hypothetical protein